MNDDAAGQGPHERPVGRLFPKRDDLYARLETLSKALESSGRIDQFDYPEAYATVLDAMNWVMREPSRSQALAEAGFVRRQSLRAMEMREALELIATPMRPDGTWNRTGKRHHWWEASRADGLARGRLEGVGQQARFRIWGLTIEVTRPPLAVRLTEGLDPSFRSEERTA